MFEITLCARPFWAKLCDTIVLVSYVTWSFYGQSYTYNYLYLHTIQFIFMGKVPLCDHIFSCDRAVKFKLISELGIAIFGTIFITA